MKKVIGKSRKGDASAIFSARTGGGELRHCLRVDPLRLEPLLRVAALECLLEFCTEKGVTATNTRAWLTSQNNALLPTSCRKLSWTTETDDAPKLIRVFPETFHVRIVYG